MKLSFSVEGDVEVLSTFEGVKSNARNLKTTLEAVGEYMLQQIDENFDSRGGKWGKWKPRLRKPRHSSLLEDTGAMRSGFLSVANNTEVSIGNSTHYFKYHQSKKVRATKLPRRIMMDITENERREIVRIVQRNLMKGVK